MATWIVYIIELNNRSFYTGITNNLPKRLRAHRRGKGSKIVRAHLPLSLKYYESKETKSDALRREAEIKKMKRIGKIKLIDSRKELEMSFPIDPLFDRVFVRKDSAQKTTSGLHLPETVKGRAVIGSVVAVGPGQRNHLGKYIKPCVAVGDKVYVKEFSGYIVKYNEEEVHVFLESEIIGIVREQQ